MLAEPFEARWDVYENVDVSNSNGVTDFDVKQIVVAVDYTEEMVEIIDGFEEMLMLVVNSWVTSF